MVKVSVKYVCECKSVKAYEIRRAVRLSGAETLVDIQNLTKASTGCGKCKTHVISILNKELEKKHTEDKQLKFDF